VAKGEALRGNKTEVEKVLIKGSGDGGGGGGGIGRGDASTATSPRSEAALSKLQVQEEVKHTLLEGKQGVKEPEQQEEPARQKELVLPVQEEVKHKLLEGKQGVKEPEQQEQPARQKELVLQKEAQHKLLEKKQGLDLKVQEQQEQPARQKELVLQKEVNHKVLEKKQGLEAPEQQEQPARQKELVLQEEVQHKLLEGKQGVEAQEQEQKKTTVLESKVDEIRFLLGKSIKKSSRLHKVIFRLKSYNGDAIDGGTIISKIVFQDLVQRIFQKIIKKHASLTLGEDTKEELWASVCGGKEDEEKGTMHCAVLQVAKWMNLPGA
jgi:hypothetical protein